MKSIRNREIVRSGRAGIPPTHLGTEETGLNDFERSTDLTERSISLIRIAISGSVVNIGDYPSVPGSTRLKPPIKLSPKDNEFAILIFDCFVPRVLNREFQNYFRRTTYSRHCISRRIKHVSKVDKRISRARRSKIPRWSTARPDGHFFVFLPTACVRVISTYGATSPINIKRPAR